MDPDDTWEPNESLGKMVVVVRSWDRWVVGQSVGNNCVSEARARVKKQHLFILSGPRLPVLLS